MVVETRSLDTNYGWEHPLTDYYKLFRLGDHLIYQASYRDLFPYIEDNGEWRAGYDFKKDLEELKIRSVIFPGAFGDENRQKFYRRVAMEVLPSPTFIPTREKIYDFKKECVVDQELLEVSTIDTFICSSLSSLPVLLSLINIEDSKKGVFISPWLGKSSLAMPMKITANIYNILNKFGVETYRGADITSLKQYLWQEKINYEFLNIKRELIEHHRLTNILYQVDPTIKSGLVEDIMDKLGIKTTYYGFAGHGMHTLTTAIKKKLDDNYVNFLKARLEELA